MRTLRKWALRAGIVLLPAALNGCSNMFSLGFGFPVPVPPWVTERMEDKYCHKNDYRTPIMPPIKEGTRPLCEDPPALDEVLRALPRVTRGIPYVYEEFRDNITYTYERVKDAIDPARFFPLVGPAQLHHCHWKCTVHYLETIESGYPFPFRCRRMRTEVVYIDKDHLHMYVCPPGLEPALTRDVMNN